jgi:hypothetical protein
VGTRPHGGRGPDALPATYDYFVCSTTSSALVVRTLGLVHLRTGPLTSGTSATGLSVFIEPYLRPVLRSPWPPAPLMRSHRRSVELADAIQIEVPSML